MSQGRNSNFPKLGCFALLNYFSVPIVRPLPPTCRPWEVSLFSANCCTSRGWRDAPCLLDEESLVTSHGGVSIERSKRTKESRDVEAISRDVVNAHLKKRSICV